MNTRHYIRKTGAWTLTAMLGITALCGCSDDTVAYSEDSPLGGSGAKAYITLTLSMSNATRSATDTPTGGDYGTSSDGTEAALSSESYVSNALVVFTTEDATGTTTGDPYPIVDAFIGTSPELKSSTDGSIVYEITIEIPEDADLSSASNVFVFCNPTDEQIEKATSTTATWTAKDTYSLDDLNAIAPWQEGSIFMSSAVLSTVTIPEDLSPYTEKRPLQLGTVKVERSVARFDYKDGAPEGNAPFTYTILSHEVEGETVPQLNVELQEIALFDMSKEFYHLRQGTASVSGMSSAQSTPLLTETSNTWVCDPNFEAKEKATSDESELEIADLFVSPLSQPSTWEWTKLSELSQESSEGYYIWRYSTENCPTSASNQRRGNTTGVVFKGEIVAPTGSEYTLDGESRIYHFEQYFFTSWNDVATTATDTNAEEEHPDLVAAYNAVMETWTDDKSETDEDVVEAMAAAGFTGYAPDEEGHYYVYYYYWNRHNDNGDNEEMGNMEFAVVRNNVYGLSVTAINELGHPQPYDDYYYEEAESDVQPESLTRADAVHFHHTPDAYPIILLDPCEEVTFITVGLHILPWIADHEAEVSLPTADQSSKNE